MSKKVVHLQTELDEDTARAFRVLCLKMRTNIKAKLAELIKSEIEFLEEFSDEELDELFNPKSKEGSQK